MPYARIRKHALYPTACLSVLLCLPVPVLAATPEAELSPVAQLFEAGGPIIVILAVLALVALGVSLVKFVQFARLSVGRSSFVADIVNTIRQGKHGDALANLEPRKSPVAKVMAAAVRGNANPEMNDTVVREETTRIAQAQLDGLERGLAVISLIATIAPLLGLLGTVLGMIEAFQQMETVGDSIEPAVLAGGIWEALLTTAAGLAVAIPAAVLFTWLQRSVDVEAQHMEDAATQVFTIPLYEAAPQNVVTGPVSSAKSADKVAASPAA
ncbi:MAG: MotA/TolQ/ExbB proton channel family protein [Pseudomonadota bacterium]